MVLYQGTSSIPMSPTPASAGGAVVGAGCRRRSRPGHARRGMLGFGAAFVAAALALGLAFLGAALTAFFATLTALPAFLAFDFILAFAGRAFFFATLFLAAWRFGLCHRTLFRLALLCHGHSSPGDRSNSL